MHTVVQASTPLASPTNYLAIEFTVRSITCSFRLSCLAITAWGRGRSPSWAPVQSVSWAQSCHMWEKHEKNCTQERPRLLYSLLRIISLNRTTLLSRTLLHKPSITRASNTTVTSSTQLDRLAMRSSFTSHPHGWWDDLGRVFYPQL